MLARIKRFLAPPVFPEDEDKTRAARTLNILLLGVMAVLAALSPAVPLIFVEKLGNAILILMTFLTFALTWWLMRRGHVRLAGAMCAFEMWLALTIFLALAGGMTSIVAVFYLATTVITGLVLGTRAALVFAGACSLAGLGMTLLEASGYPLPRFFPVPAPAGWLDMTIALALTIFALDLTLRSLNDALTRARQEIEERKKAETQKETALAALRESEERFRALVQNSSDILTIMEADGTIRYQSPAAERVLGYSPDERVGRSVLDLLDPDEVSQATQAIGSLLRTPGSTLRTELVLRHRDGSKRVLEAIGLNLLDDPAVRGIVANSRDVTEQKQAEQALRESETRYRAMFEHTKNGVVVYAALDDGADFVFKDLNPAAERISQVAREDVIGKRLLDVFPHMDRFGLLVALQRVYRTGQPEQIRAAHYRDQYREGWREYYVYRLSTGDVVAIYDDITARVQAMEALRESEEKYQRLFESSPYAMALSSLETGTILEINESNVQLFGYPREEVIGTTSQDLDIWADWSERKRLAEKLRQQGYLRSEEAEFVSKSGNHIHGLMSLEIIQIAEKKLLLGSWLDVTERKRAEEETRRRAETLAALHETALDLAAQRALPDLLQAIVARAVDLLQAKGGGIYLYRPATDDLEFVLSYNLVPDFTGTVLQRGEGLSGQVLETGQSLAVADYSQWAGQSPQYEQGNFTATVAVPISWGNRLLGVLDVLDDAPRTFSPADIALLERFAPLAAAALETTRLLQAEREQYQVAETLRQVASTLSTSLDQDQVLHLILEQLARVVDYDSASVMLLSDNALNIVAHRGLRSESQLSIALQVEDLPIASEMIGRRQPVIIPDTRADARWIYPPGSEYIRCWLGVPLMIQDRTIGFLNLDKEQPGYYTARHAEIAQAFADQAAIAIENARLFTETQSAYEELKHTQAQLIQSEKLAAIGQLAAGVAHELNNPLTTVLGFSELLLHKADPDDPDRRDLADIAEGARRARDIVRNLLSFARQSDFHRVSTDVNQMVQETLDLSRRRLQKGNIDVKERYSPGLPTLWLDVGRMKQVVLNLITNAFQAMPQGGTLTVITDRAGEWVTVRVADTGTGISPEHRSRIFDPFFTTKPVGQGTGLGLSVSLGIVQEHGGHIEVESQEGMGSTFTVWLPISPGASPDTARDQTMDQAVSSRNRSFGRE